jgi:hypothetical protein
LISHSEQCSALAIAANNEGHDFMDWYSTKNAVPVIGWLGGNVLRHSRITIDYPNKVSYWEQQSALDVHDLQYIGLTLLSRRGESYAVSRSATAVLLLRAFRSAINWCKLAR